MKRNLGISTPAERDAAIPDLKKHGDVDAWICLAKVSSEDQGFSHSTKAMHIDGVGCLVQVSTMQRALPPIPVTEGGPLYTEMYDTAEALTFVPNVVPMPNSKGHIRLVAVPSRATMVPFGQEGKCAPSSHRYGVISATPYPKDAQPVGNEYVRALCYNCGDDIEILAKQTAQ